jgi:anti-anti-sigma regulatory factor
VDASTAYVCFATCVSRRAPHVVADLSSTTFMDLAGHAALMSARAVIELRGGTFTLRAAAGQPAQLLRRTERARTDRAAGTPDRDPARAKFP